MPLHQYIALGESTYQAEGIRRKVSLLKEWNGDFTGDDAEVGGIRCLEELVEDALFLRREVKIRVSLCYSFTIRQLRLVAHGGRGYRKGRG
jgi:hypothetical protein